MMKNAVKRITDALYVPLIFVGVIWIIKIFESVFGVTGMHGGILPRHTQGLLGILTSPLLHGSFNHLVANTGPLFVLCWCLFFFYRRISWMVFPLLWLLTGIITWIIGRQAWHIGASGVIYALASFLFFCGFFKRYIPLMLISVVIAFAYGGLVWGIFPTATHVSWEGHLSGAVAGYIVAYLFGKETLERP